MGNKGLRKRIPQPLKQYITWTRATQCPTVPNHTNHCMREDQAYSKLVALDNLYPTISRLLRHAHCKRWLNSYPPSHRGLIHPKDFESLMWLDKSEWLDRTFFSCSLYFLSTLIIPLFLPSSSVSYFIFAVPMCKCSENTRTCTSSSFSIAVLNGTCCLRSTIKTKFEEKSC